MTEDEGEFDEVANSYNENKQLKDLLLQIATAAKDFMADPSNDESMTNLRKSIQETYKFLGVENGTETI
mgnify:CR=1 FL=1